MSYTLGEGCCGKVRKGLYNGRVAAIKTVPYDKMEEEDLKRECRIYATLNHKNVVNLLGPPELWRDEWHIPLEYIDGCTLEELIFPSGQLSAVAKDFIILGMCEGLSYLHSKNVVHQDLKPNNIMVRHSTNEAVIIDLGLAKFINYTESGSPVTSGRNKGFHKYAAPEAHAGNIRTRKSDVWSMGKVIAEVILGQRLNWDECSPQNVKNWLYGSKYAAIVYCMLENNPKIRVTMDEVLSHIQSAYTVPHAEHINIPTPNEPLPWMLFPLVLGGLAAAAFGVLAIL